MALRLQPGHPGHQPPPTTRPGGSIGFVGVSRVPFCQAISGARVTGAIMGAVVAGVTTITRNLDTG